MSLRAKIRNWLTEKFLIVIRKKQDFSVLGSFNVSFSRIIIMGVLSLSVIFFISLVLTRTILRQWFDPVYMETENTAKILMLSDIVDSLSVAVSQKDAYLANIQGIISGNGVLDKGVLEDSSANKPDSGNSKAADFRPSKATLSILDEFKSTPVEYSNPMEISGNSFAEAFFFTPIKGVLTAVFAPQEDHFGVDIVAKENEPVKAIADGTVILASWTLDTGYILSIQHSNELISIYKHNSVILKKVGEIVRAGEIISIIGNTGELTTGQHLHFELWYKGSPLNPQEFITFD
ncbi:M23 family metallopeptidase [Aquiflexum gelatinilyticum]|uniref:M23 family metallopeptidase n=1 Tax=Aquiflexum gelatinilyticum TaxID=2961943 RepID=UPI00216718C1|nr:M23 family metallopeptidase [Aquiflexum gelatinilyticum]MCS4435869.1 M23 family metallopeptidase [Aquiflexum gelatinilyticum]